MQMGEPDCRWAPFNSNRLNLPFFIIFIEFWFIFVFYLFVSDSTHIHTYSRCFPISSFVTASVIRNLNADLLALEEVEDCTVLSRLVALLPNLGYRHYLIKGTDTATGLLNFPRILSPFPLLHPPQYLNQSILMLCYLYRSECWIIDTCRSCPWSLPHNWASGLSNGWFRLRIQVCNFLLWGFKLN